MMITALQRSVCLVTDIVYGIVVHVVGCDTRTVDPAATFTHREERGPALTLLLGHGGQNNRLDGLHLLQNDGQAGVEITPRVGFLGTLKFVVKAITVQKLLQFLIHVSTVAFTFTKRIGNLTQRFPDVLPKHLLLRHVQGYFPQTIHIVTECDEFRGPACLKLKSLAYPCGAGDFCKSADMRQPAGPEPGFKSYRTRRRFGISFLQFEGFFEGPRLEVGL